MVQFCGYCGRRLDDSDCDEDGYSYGGSYFCSLSCLKSYKSEHRKERKQADAIEAQMDVLRTQQELFRKEIEANEHELEMRRLRAEARLGNGSAQFDLAKRYAEGKGVRQDDSLALKWYLEASRSGVQQATLCAADCFLYGKGVNKDTQKYLQILSDAAKSGDVLAILRLGKAYEKGIGTDKNPTMAFKLYEAAAKQGNADGLLEVGECYRYGFGVGKDIETALKYYGEAVHKDSRLVSALAGFYLSIGKDHWNGENGFEKNHEDALKVIKMAFDLHNTDSGKKDVISYLQELGQNYFQAENGVEKNYDQALSLLKEAYELDSKYNYHDKDRLSYKKALKLMGDYYKKGTKGIKQNYEKALEYYMMAEKSGSKKGMISLAEMYENGLGVKKNKESLLHAHQIYKNLFRQISHFSKDDKERIEKGFKRVGLKLKTQKFVNAMTCLLIIGLFVVIGFVYGRFILDLFVGD